MKTIKNILAILIIGIFSFCCTDLDEDTYTFISPESFYNTAEDLEMALTSVYDGYQVAFGSKNYKYLMYLEVVTEFGSPAYAKDNMHLWNAWVDINNADEMTFTIWDDAYNVINRANVVLGRGEGIDMDESLKVQYFAEARFIRALTYYNLLRLFGGLPIPESYTEGLDGLEIHRQTVDYTYDYIINDLKYASANLPLKSTRGANNVWRATKGGAQAFLGEVYLTRGFMQDDNAYLQLSKTYSDSVITSGEYDLEPDFKDLWYWWNTNNKNGLESIFEIQYGQFSGEYNNFHVMFGVNVTETTLGCYMYRRFGPSIQAYNSYSDNDARKEGTFLTRYYKTNDGDTTNATDTIIFHPEELGYYPGTDNWNTATPGNIKFYDRTAESATLKMPQANFYVMRFADVLLNYAEAENQLNGPTSEALENVNKVRRRAKLSNLPNGLTKEQLADSIYRERGWEFIGEGQLYFDELRTDRIGDNVKSHNDDAMAKGIYMYQKLEFVPTKKFLWKIPQYDFDSNPGLDQNPDNVSK